MPRCALETCRKPFKRARPLQTVCSPACAAIYGPTEKARKAAARARKREALARKREFLTANPKRGKLLGDAQKAFNAYIRERDSNEPCISCGRSNLADPLTGGGWDCGHFRTVAACPQLRFEPDNAHKQCKYCNTYKAQSVEHEQGVLARIGAERFAWIKGPHPLKRWRATELRAITADFKDRLKALREERTWPTGIEGS